MVGRVVAVHKKGIEVDVISPIKRGDGVAFDKSDPEQKEEGGSVYEVFDHQGNSIGVGVDNEVTAGVHLLTFAKGALDLKNIKRGDIVWRNKDPALDNRLRDLINRGDTQIVPVRVSVSGRLDEKLEVRIVDSRGREGTGESELKLSAAQKRPLAAKDVEKGIGQFGDTPFKLESGTGSIDTSELGGDLFIPSAEIKVARRRALDDLLAKRRQHNRDAGLLDSHKVWKHNKHGEDIDDEDADDDTVDLNDLESSWDIIENQSRDASPHKYRDSEEIGLPTELSLLCRNPKQVEAAIKVPWLKEICLDFLEVA